MAVFVTTQTASVDANAGLSETVTVNSPSTITLDPTNATLGTVPISGNSSTGGTATTTTTPAWATWLIIAALAYLSLRAFSH